MAIHAELQLALDYADRAEYTSEADMQELIRPVIALVSAAQREIAARRESLLLAEVTSPDTARTNQFTERLHQLLKAADTDCHMLVDCARRIAQSYPRYKENAEAITKALSGDVVAVAPKPVALPPSAV